MWAGIAQCVKRLATGWTVWGSNPGEREIFHTPLDRYWGPPSLLYNEYRVSLSGVKHPGRGDDHSHPMQRRGQRKSKFILLLPFCDFLACSSETFTCTSIFLNYASLKSYE
jgi:hypothetical protein